MKYDSKGDLLCFSSLLSRLNGVVPTAMDMRGWREGSEIEMYLRLLAAAARGPRIIDDLLFHGLFIDVTMEGNKANQYVNGGRKCRKFVQDSKLHFRGLDMGAAMKN